MVSAIDTEREHNLYGYSYVMNGDNVEIDFEGGRRMKWAIVDFDEGEQILPFSAIIKKAIDSAEDFSHQRDELAEQCVEANTELSELRAYKANVEQSAAAEQRNAVLSQFADMAGIEAFDNLVEHSAEYSIDELEEKCYAIRGRNTVAKFSADQTKATRLPVEKHESTSTEPYGGVFREYGFNPVR